MATQTSTIQKIAPRTDIEPPKMYRVIFLNDNVTTVDFVMAVLIDVFDHTIEAAQDLTQRIHNEGMATVAVLPYEVAEHKTSETYFLAKKSGFPLTVRIEVA